LTRDPLVRPLVCTSTEKKASERGLMMRDLDIIHDHQWSAREKAKDEEKEEAILIPPFLMSQTPDPFVRV
jgi:hypothetical protein